jgi:hypothetical protein
MVNMNIAPVVYSVFLRTDLIVSTMNVIKSVKPAILYIVSDQGRTDFEIEIVKENRELIESMVNWECKLVRVYPDKNIGVFGIYKFAMDYVFSFEESCIFLEEDILPSKDFFYFCSELLERYFNDPRISLITGMNSLGKYPEDEIPSYFFVDRTVNIWGHAIWKRTYSNFVEDFGGLVQSAYYESLFKFILKNEGKWYDRFKNNQTTNISSMEKNLLGISPQVFYHGLYIVPSRNLTSNNGNTKLSAHSGDNKTLPKRWRKSYNQLRYDMSFPLKHPKYLVADNYYFELINARNPKVTRLQIIADKVERIVRLFIFSDFNTVKFKIMKRLKKR